MQDLEHHSHSNCESWMNATSSIFLISSIYPISNSKPKNFVLKFLNKENDSYHSMVISIIVSKPHSLKSTPTVRKERAKEKTKAGKSSSVYFLSVWLFQLSTINNTFVPCCSTHRNCIYSQCYDTSLWIIISVLNISASVFDMVVILCSE